MAQATTPPPPQAQSNEQTDTSQQSNQQTATKTITDMQDNNNKNLPQTGSELPLLAALGLGSLGTGLFAKFRR